MLLLRVSFISVVVLTSAVAADAARVVAFDELVAHPQRYNGKFLSVTAWLQIDDTHKIASLAPRPHADASGLPEIFVDWPRSIPERRAYAGADHRVKITGVFQYRRFERRVIDPGGPGRRGFEEHTLGFGWGGIFDMQLTKISEFEVLK
jgi:hypothetical protein